MINFFSNIFGYVLNLIYGVVSNYGLAIILFSVLIKIVMLPLSIKQEKTLKKNQKIQEEMKIIQIKHNGNQEKINQEMMDLYKREKMNPFSGCVSAIIQIILLFSVFYLVRSPLTYMKKVDTELINTYTTEINEQAENRDAYPEIAIIREKAAGDERVYINMEFFGLDLSSIPSKDFSEWKTYVIPVLYVITTFISMKVTTTMQKKSKKGKLLTDGQDKEEPEEINVMEQTNRNMTYMMPIIAVSVSLIAPLGLALYWLTNNVLMIGERVILNAVIKDKEEKVDA